MFVGFRQSLKDVLIVVMSMVLESVLIKRWRECKHYHGKQHKDNDDRPHDFLGFFHTI